MLIQPNNPFSSLAYHVKFLIQYSDVVRHLDFSVISYYIQCKICKSTKLCILTLSGPGYLMSVMVRGGGGGGAYMPHSNLEKY